MEFSVGTRPDSGEIVWSDETYRIFEYDRAVKPTIDAVGQRVHPEDRTDFLRVIDDALRGATHFEHTYRLLLPDGRVKHVHALAHALQDASGDREFVGAATDVTSIKRAEEELRKSEEQWRDVFENNPTMYFMVDAAGIVLAVNPFGAEQLGYKVDELAGQTVLKVFYEQDRDASQEQFAVCLKELGNSFSLELPAIRNDGSMLWVRETARAVLRDNGPIVLIACEDITDRKQAQQKLQSQEMELRQILDLTPQLVAVFGPNGERLYANRMALDYLGISLGEWRQRIIGSEVHPDDSQRLKAYADRAMSSGSAYESELRLRKADGSYRWFLARYNPLVEEGRVRRCYMSATEIESRKQEEERVRKENVRLEERNRIAQELHDTLLQTFLSASMQLGVTVNSVSANSPVKPRLDRILQLMEQGIEEGRNTIQDLRSSTSRPFDLVRALSRIPQELAVQSGIEFRVLVVGRRQPLQPPIEHEIYRICREALVNAFCHSRAKRVEFELEYAGTDLRMNVRDNGCGIDPQVLHAGREGHWGLAGMRERAARIGGLLKISSSATAGTEVQLSIPNVVASKHSALDQSA